MLKTMLNAGCRHIQSLDMVAVTIIYCGIEVPVMNMPTISRRNGRAGSCLVIMSMAVLIYNPILGVMNMAFPRGYCRPGNIQTLMSVIIVTRSMGRTAMIVIQRTPFPLIVHHTNPLCL